MIYVVDIYHGYIFVPTLLLRTFYLGISQLRRSAIVCLTEPEKIVSLSHTQLHHSAITKT